MVRFASLIPSLTLLLVACSTEPAGGTLVGSWGNSMMEVIAQPAAAELHLPCGTRARFGGPVHLDEERRFRLTGRAKHFYGAFDVDLVGLAQGDRLHLILTEIHDGSRRTSNEELFAGVTPDFPGVVCLG